MFSDRDPRLPNAGRRHAQSTTSDPLSSNLEDPLYESVSFDDSVVDSDSHPLNPPEQVPSSAAVPAPQTSHPMRYAFSQVFGETLYDPHSFVTYGDLISTVQISPDANMIAAGDRAGRVVILSRTSARSHRKGRTQSHNDSFREKWSPVGGPAMTYDYESVCSNDNDDDDFRPTLSVPERPCYDFTAQFYAHGTLVDHLYNRKVDESISALCWAPPSPSRTLLSATRAEVKVWRLQEKKITRLISMNPFKQPSHRKVQSRSQPLRSFYNAPKSTTHTSLTHNPFLQLPRLEFERYTTTPTSDKIYQIELVSIHSLSLNSDARTVLAADASRIDMFSLENYNHKECFLDLLTNPRNPDHDDIVTASFHPSICNLLAYANIGAAVQLFDLRTPNVMRRCASRFQDPNLIRKHSSFFSAIASTISDFKFSRTGSLLLTRDYMNLLLWDMRMEKAPVLRIPVHEHLRTRMCDLFQNDCFRDKFSCCFSSDDGSLLTGSYNGMFQAFSAKDGSCFATEASLETISGLSGRQHFSPEGLSASLHANASVPELVDETRRVIKMDASKDEDIVAVAAGPGIFFYQGVNSAMKGGNGASEG